ncbi:MAG: DegV family protein [Candidatus Heimdallarchaeaceae archaeon]
MSIRIVTDSASDIDFNFAKEKGIKVVSLTVTYDNNESHKEDENFDLDKYYAHYVNDPDFFAKTSQPAPKDFLDAYTELQKEGAKEIIVITISSALSGTLNSAQIAARMFNRQYKDIKIHFVDSLNASYPETFLVEEGLKLIERGLTGEEIAEKLQKITNQIKTFILMPSLKYLRKGGRISVAKYLLGTLLKLKPITTVNEEGKNEVAATVKDFDEGLLEMIRLATKDYTVFPLEAAIIHANNEQRAKKLDKLLKEKIRDIKTRLVRTGVTISAHTGPDSVALIAKFVAY